MPLRDEPYGAMSQRIIRPPESVRSVIERIAEVVAKGGADLEKRLLLEANAKDRLEFLFSSSPYRAFYDSTLRIKRSEDKSLPITNNPSLPSVLRDQAGVQKVNALQDEDDTNDPYNPLSSAANETGNVELSFPTAFSLTPHLSSNASISRILKATALYVACNGKGFLSGLLARERTSSAYSFARGSSALNNLFQKLVNDYTYCLRDRDSWKLCLNCIAEHGDETAEELDKVKIARKCSSLQKMQALNRANRADVIEKELAQRVYIEEKACFNELDWDTFIVVDTITSSDAFDLPPPKTQQSITISKLDTSETSNSLETAGLNSKEFSFTNLSEEDQTMPVASDHPGILRTTNARRHKRSSPHLKVKCPITGQMVGVENFSNHLKVLLLDPRWKHARDHLLERASAESALASDQDVESNIAKFVLKRPDLFGSVEDELHEHKASLETRASQQEEYASPTDSNTNKQRRAR